MIRPGGVDTFTKRPRIIVECDHPGCDANEFAPHGYGVMAAAEHYPEFGWEIGPGSDAAWTEKTYPALCPAHAAAKPQACPHLDAWVQYPNRGDSTYVICGKCGARRAPKQPPSGVMSAAQMELLRRRKRLTTSTAEEGAS